MLMVRPYAISCKNSRHPRDQVLSKMLPSFKRHGATRHKTFRLRQYTLLQGYASSRLRKPRVLMEGLFTMVGDLIPRTRTGSRRYAERGCPSGACTISLCQVICVVSLGKKVLLSVAVAIPRAQPPSDTEGLRGRGLGRRYEDRQGPYRHLAVTPPRTISWAGGRKVTTRMSACDYARPVISFRMWKETRIWAPEFKLGKDLGCNFRWRWWRSRTFDEGRDDMHD